MVKKNTVIILLFITLIFTSPCYSLINIDNESVDLAVKYGIKNKDLPSQYLLDNNWKNDGTGIILNIYSPFIQIASKSQKLKQPHNTEEEYTAFKNKLRSKITKITRKNEIRFIVAFYGDKIDFAKDYEAIIQPIENGDNNKKKKHKTITLKPKKSLKQKDAELDRFHPKHPYSAINSYTFKFNELKEYNKYYFIVKNESVNVVKFLIDNNKIF